MQSLASRINWRTREQMSIAEGAGGFGGLGASCLRMKARMRAEFSGTRATFSPSISIESSVTAGLPGEAELQMGAVVLPLLEGLRYRRRSRGLVGFFHNSITP
jgi:hypothetical protein